VDPAGQKIKTKRTREDGKLSAVVRGQESLTELEVQDVDVQHSHDDAGDDSKTMQQPHRRGEGAQERRTEKTKQA